MTPANSSLAVIAFSVGSVTSWQSIRTMYRRFKETATPSTNRWRKSGSMATQASSHAEKFSLSEGILRLMTFFRLVRER